MPSYYKALPTHAVVMNVESRVDAVSYLLEPCERPLAREREQEKSK
jgi:hypothetical protein